MKRILRFLGVVSIWLLCNVAITSFGYAEYKGVTLRVLCGSGQLSKAWRTTAQQWAKEHDAKVVVAETSMESLYDKMMAEFITETGAYDIVQYPPFWNGDVMGGGFLLPLDDFIEKKDPQWDDYMPVYRDRLSKWGDKIYALQIDGDIFIVCYRKDLWEDSSEKVAFAAKYGYELSLPQTWEQYIDMAKFFTRDTTGDGKIDFWGTADCLKPGHVWWFLARLASYLDTPYLYKGGIYFDPDTMEPYINSPAGLKAMDVMLQLASPECSPPGVANYGWAEVGDAFPGGQLAMAFAWSNLAFYTIDPDRSRIKGKVGCTLMPGALKVWNVITKKWREVDEPHRASPLAWGWCLGIPKDTKNSEAAYDLIRFMVTGERAIRSAMTTDDGFEPYRKSQFESEKVQRFYEQEGIPDYIVAVKGNIAIGIPDLRIPGTKEYYDSLELTVSEIVTGIKNPKEALDECAKKWQEITKRRGFEKQRELYRSSLGL